MTALNRLSSARSLISSPHLAVRAEGGRYPKRLVLRIKPSSLSLSPAFVYPHQAGAAYISLASVEARATSCKAVEGRPWLRRTRRAYSDDEHELRTSATCVLIFISDCRYTPSTLRHSTLCMLPVGGGKGALVPRLETTFSEDLFGLSRRLLFAAQVAM